MRGKIGGIVLVLCASAALSATPARAQDPAPQYGTLAYAKQSLLNMNMQLEPLFPTALPPRLQTAQVFPAQLPEDNYQLEFRRPRRQGQIFFARRPAGLLYGMVKRSTRRIRRAQVGARTLIFLPCREDVCGYAWFEAGRTYGAIAKGYREGRLAGLADVRALVFSLTPLASALPPPG